MVSWKAFYVGLSFFGALWAGGIFAQTAQPEAGGLNETLKELGVMGVAISGMAWFARHMIVVVIPEKEKEHRKDRERMYETVGNLAREYRECLDKIVQDSDEARLSHNKQMHDLWEEFNRHRAEDRKFIKEMTVYARSSKSPEKPERE